MKPMCGASQGKKDGHTFPPQEIANPFFPKPVAQTSVYIGQCLPLNQLSQITGKPTFFIKIFMIPNNSI